MTIAEVKMSLQAATFSVHFSDASFLSEKQNSCINAKTFRWNRSIVQEVVAEVNQTRVR